MSKDGGNGKRVGGDVKINEALEELRLEKAALESDLETMIRKRIDEFKETTGLPVTNIDVDFTVRQTLGSKRPWVKFDGVRVNIDLTA